jgi:hypothetical protein
MLFPSLVSPFTLIGYLALGEAPSISQCSRRAQASRPQAPSLPSPASGGGIRVYSGPAYLPALCGNIDFTILKREMSTVASMWRKIAASRKIFSTPKSSMTPLPP